MSDDDKTYIGINACGCVTYISIAGDLPPRQERAELKRVIKGGRRIEITTAGDARERFTFDCPHYKHVEDVEAEVDRLVAEANAGA